MLYTGQTLDGKAVRNTIDDLFQEEQVEIIRQTEA